MDFGIDSIKAHFANARRTFTNKIKGAPLDKNLQSFAGWAIVRGCVARAPKMPIPTNIVVACLATAAYKAGEYAGRQIYNHTNLAKVSERVGEDIYRRFPNLFS